MGSLLLIISRGQRAEISSSAEAERQALERQHADRMREKDETIAELRGEANSLASELNDYQREAESRVSALNQELQRAHQDLQHAQEDVQRAQEEQSKAKVDPAEIASLKAQAAEKEAEAARVRAELAEAKVNLAAIERTHQVALSAKESEYKIILREKEESFRRERDLVSSELRVQMDEQRRMFAQTERALSEKINSLSDVGLKEATQRFLQAANEGMERTTSAVTSGDTHVATPPMDDLLRPVREALDRLERRNQEMERRREHAFESIEKAIQQLSQEADQLANALRKPATQGAWGEMTITTILENAGLISGEHFVIHESGEDNRKRTDVVIKLPQDRLLVIDSKAPLDAFWDGMNAPNAETRAIRMKAHARMVRDHVKELGSTYYWSSYDKLPDCVIMFLPTEGAYFAALEADPSLLQEAKDAGVYLANPMTVLNMAHIAAYVLADDRVRHSAQEIQALGSELYERLRQFGDHFSSVGKNLRQSVDSYNKALAWIDRNVMPTARKMQLLGAGKGAGKALKSSSPVDASVNSFQGPDLRELPVERTYDDGPEEA